jgi:hypothetical protein
MQHYILTHLLSAALDAAVGAVTITVPVYFWRNHKAKTKLREIARIISLNVDLASANSVTHILQTFPLESTTIGKPVPELLAVLDEMKKKIEERKAALVSESFDDAFKETAETVEPGLTGEKTRTGELRILGQKMEVFSRRWLVLEFL